MYTFEEQEIDKLEAQVQKLTDALHLALNTLCKLDANTEVQEAIDEIDKVLNS